nr:hypothetical protein [uncultured Holophaga sp.]
MSRKQEDIDYDRVDRVVEIFLSTIPRLTYHPNTYTTSSSLVEVIQSHIDFDLPDNYAPVISRAVYAIVKAHHLPFHRKSKTKARHAAFVGMDQGEVERLFILELRQHMSGEG